MDDKNSKIGNAFHYRAPHRAPPEPERAAYFLAVCRTHHNSRPSQLAEPPGLPAGYGGRADVADLLGQFGGMNAGTRWSNPLDFLRLHHCMQFELAVVLATIADDMNDSHTQVLARRARDYLVWEMPLHHAHEIVDLRETLDDAGPHASATRRLMERLERNHRGDAALIDSVVDGLSLLSDGRYPKAPEKLSVRLLQLSASLRRNIAWEDETLLPIVGRLLSVPARRRLLLSISARRGAGNASSDGAHRS